MRWRQPTFCACNQRWNACAWTAVRAAKDKLDCGAQQLKFGAAVLGAAALLATTAPGVPPLSMCCTWQGYIP
jgi:hypothetical protein